MNKPQIDLYHKGYVAGYRDGLRDTARRKSTTQSEHDITSLPIRAINVIINNLKGIFFDDDDVEHMACGIVADWGEPGMTEIGICDLQELKKCKIFC